MVGHQNDLKALPIGHPDARAASIRALVSPSEGWEDHVLRIIDVGPGGHTPRHAHPWFHVNYVLAGQGELLLDGTTTPVTAGSYAYIPGNAVHQFRNVGEGMFSFLCIVPKEGHR